MQELSFTTQNNTDGIAMALSENLQSVVDRHEAVISDEEITTAKKEINLAKGREQFTFSNMLPLDLAEAIDLIQQCLPTDPLSAVMAYLCGVSGLLKIGTMISSAHDHCVPCNLFVGMVARSGIGKTPTMQKLVVAPAKQIRLEAKKAHEKAMREWEEICKGLKKDERPKPPRPLWPHLSDYSPESLTMQFELHESRGLGMLLIRDELSGLLQALQADSSRGRGTGEAQLLETFDGTGSTSIRVEAGFRSYERCHVSLYGNIQPEKLRQLMNGNDPTGKFARILMVKIPVVPLTLRDEDPTENERSAYASAQNTLAEYANRLYRLAPKTYELTREARKYFNSWVLSKQRIALAPTTDPLIAAMLGKASAHALRLSGVLHLVHHSDGQEHLVGLQTMQLATEIVDQLLLETELFHESPSDRGIMLMRHINDGVEGEVTYEKARAKGTRKLRGLCKSKDFQTAVRSLVNQGFGEIVRETPLTYRSVRPLP